MAFIDQLWMKLILMMMMIQRLVTVLKQRLVTVVKQKLVTEVKQRQINWSGYPATQSDYPGLLPGLASRAGRLSKN